MKGALSGAIAGAVSGFVMEKVQTAVMPKVKEAVKSATENVKEVTERHDREQAAQRRFQLDGGEPERRHREPEHARSDAELTYDEGTHQQVVEASRQPQAASEIGRGGGGATHARQERQREKQDRKKQGKKQEPATVKAAQAVSEKVLGRELRNEEKKTAGKAAHYWMSTTSGTIYGIAAEYDERVTLGYGTAFGAAVWAIADEAVVPALGFSKKPTEYPPSTHAYALASHLVYGATTELVRRNVRKLMD